MTVVIDWCDRKAAEYAVMHWHYSKAMPAGKLSHVGLWEDGQFIGAVIFGRGANNHIASPYGLGQNQVCELVRIAMRGHKTPVSAALARSIKLLKRLSPELRLIVSYADPEQNHIGIVYQASNWVYTGKTKGQRETLTPSGDVMHKRTANSKYGTITGLPKSKVLWKHKYLYPLDAAMRKQIEPLRKPYPKRAEIINGDLPDVQSGEGGSIPTSALQSQSTLEGVNNGA